MIELLIVIAVLGILAVAVLSAINPIEQINRSKDTGSRSDAEQLISALDRFYAAKGYYAWQSNPSDGQAAKMNTMTTVNYANSSMNSVLNALSGTTGELKEAYISRITASDYNVLYLYNRGAQGSSTYVCFIPKSNSFLDDATKRCGVGMPSDFDVTSSVCNAGGTNGNNLSCLP